MLRPIRLALYPFSIILIVYSLFVSNYYLTALGMVTLVFAALFFSHRKQRIRYWFQGYATNYFRLKDNQAAIDETQQEFCSSKYANEDVCSNKYSNVKDLIRDIIKLEYKFKSLLEHDGSPSGLERSIKQFAAAKSKLDKEIEEVASEKI